MGRGSLIVVLACTGWWLVSASNDTNGTNGTTQDPVKVKVKVQGQSGKFTVYEESKGEASGININMDALREVDADGNAVGASGSTKHSINTFASQSFTIEDAVMETLGDVQANKIAFSSPISTIGQIRVDTYIMATAGTVGTPSESWSVKPGDLKWNIELSSWTWCGCQQGQTIENGAFVDLDVTVKGKKDASSSADGKNKTLDLGDGLTMQLSDQVKVDGLWVSMPTGYPKVSMQGSSTTLTFRFPKFETSALYDPTITGIDSGSGDPANITGIDSGSGASVDMGIQAHPAAWVTLPLLALVAGRVTA